MTRSVSQAEQYLDKCAYAYFLRRVEGVSPRPAAWSHQGTAFHSACEAFELSGRQMTAEDAVELFSTEYSDAVNKSLDKEPDTDRWMTAGPDGVSDIEARYVLGRQQTAAYVTWAKDNGPQLWKAPDGVPGIELHLTASIGGIRVQGYIDQLVAEPDGSVRIRDLKTGSTKSRFQLQTYAVLVRKALGLEVNAGDWYQARKGGLTRPVDLSGVTEDEVGERYAEMDQAVKRAEFPARPGFNCRFCDVSHACSLRR
ncbi:PD-(D/E)XK nuclease family protein [Streptomyces sp. NBC_00885]|uniref:RecB family exonuclease n=1 Tax=Streptomyces sp. NBC_00885 TaxID=2975857 RepID=UPI0038705E28|nr:PD-(D/E)XK nuclease family protein [Streptomyces sp. NBC_00885]